MSPQSRSEIIRALAEYRHADILGTPEATTLDFKRCLYPLDTDKGKYDLCSDVVAMANADGGILVCGFVADKAPTEVHELASKAVPVPRSRLDVSRHKDVLVRYIWPLVSVDFSWFDVAVDNAAEGFLVIEVEPLPDHQHYAIVRQILTVDGKLREGFTVPVRHGDQTTYLAAEQLHRLMTDGHRLRDFAAAIPATDSTALSTRELNERIDALMKTRPSAWDNEPLLFWQSTPHSPAGLLDGLYDADGVYGVLNDPKPLRPAGFHLAIFGERPRVDAGALTVGEPRRAVRIDPDGTVTAAALANNDMLGWNMDQVSNGRMRLNVTALTEMTLEYFRLVDEHVMPRVSGTWRHRILATRFQTPETVKLGEGGNPQFPMISNVRPASAQEWDKSWQAIGNPERDAYEALKQLYALFGVSVTKNPFIDGDRVDSAALLAAASR